MADGKPHPAGGGSRWRRTLDDIEHAGLPAKNCFHDGSHILRKEEAGLSGRLAPMWRRIENICPSP
jgi:hypothetical protein